MARRGSMGYLFSERFINDYCSVASRQARISYLFMSIHSVNPGMLTNFLDFNPGSILFSNMLYGLGCCIFARPAMRKLNMNYRLVYSVLGSFMFSTTSLLVFNGIYEWLGHRRIWASIAGFFAGKLMYSFFSSYLYFVDVCVDPTLARTESRGYMFREQ